MAKRSSILQLCGGQLWGVLLGKVKWDASQPPRDPAIEHLSKCGQTDESRLGALPPKGRVTFSGDNMGLLWQEKNKTPMLFGSVPLLFPHPFFRSSSSLSILISLVLFAAITAECLFYSLTGQKTWQSSKSLPALHQGGKWLKMWLSSTKENDYWQWINRTAVQALFSKSLMYTAFTDGLQWA